jgi:hypothetical protein
MAQRLREADNYPDARVVGWENREGTYHGVYDTEMEKIGRAPSDRQLEGANRVLINWDGDFYTVDALTPDYDLGEAIDELKDLYGDQ